MNFSKAIDKLRQECREMTINEHFDRGHLKKDKNYDIVVGNTGIEYREWMSDTERGFEIDKPSLLAVMRFSTAVDKTGHFLFSTNTYRQGKK